MQPFVYQMPTKFIFGKGRETETGIYIKEFGGSKVLLHYGGESAEKSGLLQRIEASLKAENIDYIKLGGVKPNPKSPLIYEGIQKCRAENVDFILAVGGGSVIDSAKAIGLGVTNEEDIWEYYSKKKSPTSILPVGVVLTIAAAGSEGSDGSVVSFEREDGVYKRDCGGAFMRPKFSILNPELTQTLPKYQTACGIVDMIAHVAERYFTNTKDVELTDNLAEGIMKTIVCEGRKAMEDPGDYQARANLMWAGTLAHNNLCGMDREQDWSSHNLEHELSALYDCAHGAGLAVVMPAWMEYVMHHDLERFARFAVHVFGCQPDENLEQTAKAGIEELRKFWKSIGMPQTIEELGGKREDIPTIIKMLEIEGRTLGGFVKLEKEDCTKIYQMCCK